jgi:hypothetical protein
MAGRKAILPRSRLLACRPLPTGMANSYSSTARSECYAIFIRSNSTRIYNSFSPGVNWTLTSRCSGSVIGLFTRTPSTITQLVGTGVNYATTTSATETGKCSISNQFSVLFNGSVTDTTNSNPLDAVNNSNSKMIAAGIEYAQGDDNVTVLASKTDTNYSNRSLALNTLGLSNTIVYNNLNASYTRTIDPNLSVTGQLGLVGVTNAVTLGLPKTLLPTYSLAVTWAITPKVSLTASPTRLSRPRRRLSPTLRHLISRR